MVVSLEDPGAPSYYWLDVSRPYSCVQNVLPNCGNSNIHETTSSNLHFPWENTYTSLHVAYLVVLG